MIAVAVAAVPNVLDGDFGATGVDWEVLQNCCDPLVEYPMIAAPGGGQQLDLTAQPVCLLCESFEIAPDGLTISFKLKQGVTSAFGNELKAEDVRWSWERGIEVGGSMIQWIDSFSIDASNPITVTDDYSFEVNLTAPNPTVLLAMAVPFGNGGKIMDSTEVKKHVTASDPWAKDWLSTNTAGFGPYQVESFVPGQEVVWTAMPNYHRTPPQASRIIYRQVPDSATRVALLQRGEVDIAMGLDTPQLVELRKQPGVAVDGFKGNLAFIFGMNNQVPPLDNVKVRQAIAYALPVLGIQETVFNSDPANVLAPGYMPADYPGALDAWPYQEDVEKGKQLLQEAGVGNISFQLSYNAQFAQMEQIAILIKTRLAELGIDVQLNKLAPAAYQEQYFSRKAQTVLVNDASFLADGPYAMTLYFDSKVGVGDWVNYANPQVDQLLAEARSSLDGATRADLARQANEIVVGEAPWGFYLHSGWYVARRDNVGGVVWRPNNALRFYDLTKQ